MNVIHRVCVEKQQESYKGSLHCALMRLYLATCVSANLSGADDITEMPTRNTCLQLGLLPKQNISPGLTSTVLAQRAADSVSD